MKKFLSVFISLLCVMTLGLAGCSKDKPECPRDDFSENSPYLVAYFSRTNHTGEIADEIADELECDIYRIVPTTAYPSDYNQTKERAQQEKDQDQDVDFLKKLDNLDKYTVIFLGFPIWFDDIPMVIKTFVQQYTIDGKMIVPFCTSEGSTIDNARQHLSTLLPNSNIQNGITIANKDVMKSKTERQIENWLMAIGF